MCVRHFVSTNPASGNMLIHFAHVFRKIIVVGFRARTLSFTWNFTVKYTDRLAHAHYYPCNRYQAFIFRASVRPFRCVREKLGLGTRLGRHQRHSPAHKLCIYGCRRNAALISGLCSAHINPYTLLSILY